MTIHTSGQSDSPIVILMPIFTATSGREVELEQALLTLQTASRLDPGCLEYSVFADLNDTGRFILHEEWATKELLADHNLQAHVVGFLARSGELLSEPFGVTWMRPIGH